MTSSNENSFLQILVYITFERNLIKNLAEIQKKLQQNCILKHQVRKKKRKNLKCIYLSPQENLRYHQ